MKLDLLGKVFGRLTVIEELPSDGKGTNWLCLCECENVKVVRGFVLSSKRQPIKSCGCLRSELAAKRAKNNDNAVTHGMAYSETYSSWAGAKYRAKNEMSERWSSFENFLKDMGKKPEDTKLVRLDTSKPYEAGNCAWLSNTEYIEYRKQNARVNSRVAVVLGDKTLPLAELAASVGMDYNTLRNRIVVLGWAVQDAINKPVKKYKQR